MSGTAVIVTKLKAYATLTAIVPAARIMAGEFPLNTVAPAISVLQVSSVPRNRLSMNPAKVMHADRIQVTVMVTNPQTATTGTGYTGLRTILKHVLAACPNVRATVSSVAVDSIIPDLEGPDTYSEDPALIFGSRDFFVRWTAA